MRTVYCQHLKKEAEGLDFPPLPGELGQKIFDNISRQAWEQWIGRQTMLINEYRLSTADSKAKEYLRQEMVKFLFED